MSKLGYTWSRKPMPNQPKTIFIKFDIGGEFSISELSEKHNLGLGVIRHRIYRDVPLSELFKPARKTQARAAKETIPGNADKPLTASEVATITHNFWSKKLA